LVARHAIIFESSEQTWRRTAAEAEAMMYATGRRPNPKSNDPAEKRLARWIQTQIMNHTADPSTSKQILRDTQIHSEWVSLCERHAALMSSAEQMWRRSATEAETIMHATGRRPRSKSKDPHEKRLGAWIATQVLNYATDPATSKCIMRDVRIHCEWTALVKRHPALFETKADSWRRAAAEAEAMIHATGRRPRQKSSDSHEQRIGAWIGTQLQNHAATPAMSRNIMRDDGIYAEWKSFVDRHAVLFSHTA